jgi:hypothetical protein
MRRALKAAFLLRVPLQGLGALPLNVLAVSGFAILGLGHPGFWLLGAGLEAGYLALLAGNRRFQRLVDGQGALALQQEAAARRDQLVHRLAAGAQNALRAQEAKCERIKALYAQRGLSDAVIEANRDTLRKLVWTYLKLLLARDSLESEETWTNEDALKRQMQTAEKELGQAGLNESVRESKQATLGIFRRRLENRARRSELLEEIKTDLARIEAQLDLAVENAAMQERQPEVSANLRLASDLLDQSLFGDSLDAVADLEERYDHLNRLRPPQQIKVSA